MVTWSSATKQSNIQSCELLIESTMTMPFSKWAQHWPWLWTHAFRLKTKSLNSLTHNKQAVIPWRTPGSREESHSFHWAAGKQTSWEWNAFPGHQHQCWLYVRGLCDRKGKRLAIWTSPFPWVRPHCCSLAPPHERAPASSEPETSVVSAPPAETWTSSALVLQHTDNQLHSGTVWEIKITQN